MNKLLYLAVFLAIRVMRALYLPFRLLPVRNKITMISRQSDTPSIDMKLLQKAIQDRRPDYQVVILAKQLHNPVIYLIQIFRQMYHIATSRAVILDSYCIPISVLHHRKGLIVIQMWHSIGSMKKFGYVMLGKEEGSDPKLASLMCMHRNYTYVLISSFSYLKDYIEGFRISEDKVLQIPLPRADLLTDKAYLTARRKEIIKKAPWIDKKKNILYCPTFRKTPSPEDEKKIQELIHAIDFKHYNLIYKPHSVSTLKIKDMRVITTEMDNIDALSIADYMVTDYSSIMYEAGLAGVPVYMYTYDWDQYKTKRAFNLDLERDVPALFTADAEEIFRAIQEDRFDRKAFEAFTMKNCVIPEPSCIEQILRLMDL